MRHFPGKLRSSGIHANIKIVTIKNGTDDSKTLKKI